MKRVLKGFEILAIAACLFGISVFAWLYFYTADLPPISQLDAFNPVSESEASIRFCDSTEAVVTALPGDMLGKYLVAALIAAEGKPDPRSPFLALFAPDRQHVAGYSVQLARTLACERRPLSRQLEELRIANAIHRKFSDQQILTIYLNRVYLGPDTYGIEAGANRYFRKSTSDLSLGEAALLAGLIRGPNRLSPVTHPERATERRNSVLDEMVNQGSVLRADADVAKQQALGSAILVGKSPYHQ